MIELLSTFVQVAAILGIWLGSVYVITMALLYAIEAVRRRLTA
jgi:hypothetical protein